jgi:diguanylate cyclase (GGDEF)-like protein
MALCALSSAGLSFAVFSPSFVNDALALQWLAILAVVVSLGGGILLARRLLRQVSSALSHLGEAASRLAAGLPLVAASTRFRETDAVGESLIRMASVLQRRNLELARAIAAKEIADLERQHLEFLATHDALTGLTNRRGFDSLLVERIEGCGQHRGSLALLYIDMDGFKSVNDQLGHEVGDELLQCFAERLKSGVRSSDVVARLGGDEFALILEQADHGRAVQAADALIHRLSRPYCIRGESVEISASIGIAVNTEVGVSPVALIEAADAAMYRAKTAGKARYASSAFGELAA